MPRRVWWVILGAGFCVTVLPGCAPLDSFLNRGGASGDQSANLTSNGSQQKNASSFTPDLIDANVAAPDAATSAKAALAGRLANWPT